MTAQMHVLLVEDNPGDAELIAESLRSSTDVQFDIRNAYCLEEAMPYLKDDDINVVMLDLGLPDSFGLETLYSVREAAPNKPIVVITGNENEAVGLEAVKQGAQDYLIKGKMAGHWLSRVLQYAVERQQAKESLRESEAFLRSTLDALSANIAILDKDGVITAVNTAWREFAQANAQDHKSCSAGTNYLKVCDEAKGEDAALAAAFAAGIRAVLQGRSDSFEMEYPCHSPDEKRWFIGRVTRFDRDSQPRVVIAHENVSAVKIAEEKTRKSQAALSEAESIAGTGTFIWTIKDDSLWWSDNMYRIAGLKPNGDNLDLRTFIDRCVHPEDKENFEKRVREAAKSPASKEMEYRIVRPDGEVRVIHSAGRFIYDNDGRASVCIGANRDVTEQKQDQDRLKEAFEETKSREFQMAMLSNSAQAVMEARSFEAAAKGVFEACLRATGATAGYVTLLDKEKNESKALLLETGNKKCSVARDTPMPLRGLREKAHKGKKAIVENDFSSCKDSSLLPNGHAELSCVLLAPLIIDGKAVGTLAIANKPSGFIKDDEKLVLAFAQQLAIAYRNDQDNEALLESEYKYRTYVDSSPVAIIIAEEDGAIIDANSAACMMYERRRDELLSASVFDLAISNGTENVEHIVEKLQSEGAFSGEMKLQRPGDSEIEISLRARSLTDGRYLIYCSDITERVSLESQLRHAQKMEAIGRLAGGIAHDFNNILHTMIGYSELLIEELETDKELQDFSSEILHGAEHAASLTRQLLAFSRRQVLKLENTNLNDVITSLSKMLIRVIGEDINVEFELEQGLRAIRADRGQMEQVLMNLAVNARDAMPSGGQLTVRTENIFCDFEESLSKSWIKPGRYVLLSVSDNGLGMDTETMAQVFEPFFTTKEVGRGTGLGLATVHGIITQHKGTIDVFSQLNEGTTFRLFLPVAEGAVVEEQKEDLVLNKNIQRGDELILFVEDDAKVRKLTCRILENAGYRVLQSINGEDALEVYDTHKEDIDIVISDVVMPILSGPQMYEKIKAQNPKLRFLFASGYSSRGILSNFVKENSVEFIQKPYAPAILLHKVREILDRP